MSQMLALLCFGAIGLPHKNSFHDSDSQKMLPSTSYIYFMSVIIFKAFFVRVALQKPRSRHPHRREGGTKITFLSK